MIVCFDTESPVGYTPSGVLGFVCMTYTFDGETAQIAQGRTALDLWLTWMRDPAVELLGHSVAHDMCVMAQAANPEADPGTGWAYELVWRTYDAERVRCSYIRQRLIDIAAGVGYMKAGLGPLVKRYGFGETQEKTASKAVQEWLKSGKPVEEWPPEIVEITPLRFRYGLIEHAPLESWGDALTYALDDPKFTRRVFDTQPAGVLVDEVTQTRAAFDLEILSKHGWVTDLPRVKRLLALYGAVMSETYLVMRDTGLVSQKRVWPESDPRHRVDESLSTKAIKALVWDALGAAAPLTKKAKKIANEHEGDLEWYAAHVCTDAVVCTNAVVALGGRVLDMFSGDGERGAIERVQDASSDLAAWVHASGPSSAVALNAKRLYKLAQHRVTNYLKALDTTNRVRSYYTPLLETGRTSTAGPCLNYPRGFDVPPALQIRGCILPDPGRVFLVVDYAQLELCTLAQTLTDLMRGKLRDPDYLSSLALAINDGMDCHVMVAANLLGASYDEIAAIHKVAKDKAEENIPWTSQESEIEGSRQVSKIGNYGYWGGMGAKKFIVHAAKQGVDLTLAQSQRVKDAVFGTWYESKDYFGLISDLTKRSRDDRCAVRLPRSGRVRGGCYYSQAANYLFQGPAADGCKESLKRINHACLRDPNTELYKANSRPVAFIHDEFIVAADDPLVDSEGFSDDAWKVYRTAKKLKPNKRDDLDFEIILLAEAALHELERHMVEGMREVTPDVRIEAEGRILRERWTK